MPAICISHAGAFERAPAMNPLLAGVRILDLTRLLPGPFCTQYLAQLGAEVIKIEEPDGGDYARLLSPELFALVNRGKRSVALDLRRSDDAATFREMVCTADVVIESFRPGVMERLGCGHAVLRALRPSLVYVALTGYGHSGPDKDLASHDINFWARGAALDQNRAADGTPVLGNVQLGDLAGGALTGAIALLAALYGARESGQGSFVDVGMVDGVLALQAVATATLRTLGRTLPGGQDMLSGALPHYNVYACADGRHLVLGAMEPKFFIRFCTAVERPDLLELSLAPDEAGSELRVALQALFKRRTRDEWEALLGPHDCCVSAVHTLEEALADPQVRARGLWIGPQDKPEFRFPAHFSDARTIDGAAAPVLGADTPQSVRRSTGTANP